MSSVPPPSLPAGCSVMLGDDGQQYITVEQDGQTYAIPASDFSVVQQEAPGNQPERITIEDVPAEVVVEAGATQQQQMVMIPVSKPLSALSLQPVDGPPPQMTTATSLATSISPSKPIASPAVTSRAPIFGSVGQKNYKPIRVDNWGIFLLNVVQGFFQKKEHCDLTLRFPAKNAQIKVHSLIVNACTDYFLQLDSEGKVVDGAVDMPEEFTPDAVAAIVRFMYTGRLEVRGPGIFDKLLSTATALKMTVLTKLMDAQLNASEETLSPKKAVRRRRQMDPVKQMKYIKKVEKKFNDNEKRAKLQAKMEASKREQEVEDFGNNTIPGKKLPIWKKRSTGTPHQEDTPQKTRSDESNQASLSLTPVTEPPPNISRLVPVRAKQKSYNRDSTGETTPKVSSKVRELQTNLTFEKIRRTAAKNASGELADVSLDELAAKDMSVEEIGAFMAEQRRKLAEEDDDYDDDDDYYDNDAGLDYDEATMEEDDETVLPSPPSAVKTTKPILKMERVEESTPRKSVRFSLRPGNVPTPSQIDANESLNKSPSTLEHSPPKKRGRKPRIQSPTPKEPIDVALEEFEKAAEQEKQSSAESPQRRSARKLKETNKSPTPPAKKARIDLPKPKTTKSKSQDKNQMIKELLKKYPDLLKDNKQVKVKMMVKDASGKTSLQFVTVRASDYSSPSSKQAKKPSPGKDRPLKGANNVSPPKANNGSISLAESENSLGDVSIGAPEDGASINNSENSGETVSNVTPEVTDSGMKKPVKSGPGITNLAQDWDDDDEN